MTVTERFNVQNINVKTKSITELVLGRITDLQEVHKNQELIQTREEFVRGNFEIREIYQDALEYYNQTKGSSFPWMLKRPKKEPTEVKEIVQKYYCGIEKTGFPMGDAEDPVLALFEIAFGNVSGLSKIEVNK